MKALPKLATGLALALVAVWSLVVRPAALMQAAPACPTADVSQSDVRQSIGRVQGTGARSPLEGGLVTVQGTVTGDFQPGDRLGGFFVQDARGDGDPATSDGLFVNVPASSPLAGTDVKPGDLVQVAGTARELTTSGDPGSLTALDAVTSLVVCGAGPAAAPLAVALPADLERLEGTLVTFAATLTVSDTFGLGRYGELVVSAGRLFTPTNGNEPGGSAEANARRRFVLDDASNRQNPAPTPYTSAAGPAGTRRAGDTVSGLTGVLSYGFGAYRLQPTAPPTFKDANPRPAAPAAVGGTLRVASFNVLNYFTSPGSRGATNAAELGRQRAKLVAALRAISADVVGLIELENNAAAGPDLVAALNAALGSAVYTLAPDPAGGVGSDEIKTAFLYKPARVVPVGPSVSDPDPVHNRFPLAQTFRQPAAPGGVFTAVVNHFKSKGGCPGLGAVPADPANDDTGQGCWNAVRLRQAAALLAFATRLRASSGDPDLLLLGDLNAYALEDPVRAIVSGGFEALESRLPAAERYSFVFQGQAGSLDHALASASLAPQVSGLTIWHVNADEPTVLDYNTEFKTDDRYAPTPYRSSDHDPVVVGLNLR